MCVWRNPISAKFSEALRTGSHRVAGLRALVTASDLWAWQSISLSNAGFVRQAGIDGVRVRLSGDVVSLNHETIAFPTHFSWIFPDPVVTQALNVDDRRITAARWLRENPRIRHLYPNAFRLMWYSWSQVAQPQRCGTTKPQSMRECADHTNDYHNDDQPERNREN
jgi:hypothetical protein